MVASSAGLALLVFRRFELWPLWILPLMPLAGLAPWTGWFVVEEWDVLVLAVATGGYLRLAIDGRVGPFRIGGSHLPATWLVALAFAGFTFQAAGRGVGDAGGIWWSWWQGYHDPLNAWRLAKPVAAVLLLLPLWHARCARVAAHADRTLLYAMVGLALTASLPVWIERAAFPGLTNMSTDYRATGSFWEMQVGGAALDAVLSMAAPFALSALLAARSRFGATVAATCAVIVLYAALATFSRIVYVAVPLALVVCGVLQLRQSSSIPMRAMAWSPVLLISFAGAAVWVFPQAGYRGTGALLGCIALMLPLSGRPLGRWAAMVGGIGGLFAAATVWWLSPLLPKGPYLALVVALAAGVAAAALSERRAVGSGALGLGSFIAGVAALVTVAAHWGGAEAAWHAVEVAVGLVCLALMAVLAPRWAWPAAPRWQGMMLVAAVGVAAVAAVFMGGAYMAERVTSVREDGKGRQHHWGLLFAQMNSLEQHLFGRGLGRTPYHLATAGETDLAIGDMRWERNGTEAALHMLSGRHVQGWGEVLRLSQRVERPVSGPLRLWFRLKAETALTVHAEVCDKHLLYDGACRIGMAKMDAASAGWVPMQIELGMADLHAGSWYAPRGTVFSLALALPGARAEVDDLRLIDSSGSDLLSNGSFEDGMARWFLTSDRHHLPWHAKNMVVHLWIEQGLLSVGVLALGLVILVVRVATSVRHHPMAPPVVGGLAGVLTVGLVDSVADMPRAMFLMLWLLLVGLALPHTVARTTGAGSLP